MCLSGKLDQILSKLEEKKTLPEDIVWLKMCFNATSEATWADASVKVLRSAPCWLESELKV